MRAERVTVTSHSAFVAHLVRGGGENTHLAGASNRADTLTDDDLRSRRVDGAHLTGGARLPIPRGVGSGNTLGQLHGQRVPRLHAVEEAIPAGVEVVQVQHVHAVPCGGELLFKLRGEAGFAGAAAAVNADD